MADAILNELANKSVEYITWYLSLNDKQLAGSYEDVVRNFYILDDVNKLLIQSHNMAVKSKEGKSNDMASHYTNKFEQLYKIFNSRAGVIRK